jgi:hypothetical protein
MGGIQNEDYMDLVNRGPLDLVREINEKAADLDLLAMKAEILNKDDLRQIQMAINEFDEAHPLMDQEVVVYGTSLRMNADLDPTTHGLLLPADNQEYEPVRGIYRGFAMRPTYHTEQEYVSHRVVHMVRTGVSEYYNRYYSYVTEVIFGYTCAYDSEVLPAEPLNAHSLVDLAQDDVIDNIDKIAYGRDRSTAVCVKAIAEYVNKILVDREQEAEKNHQRVSYLNSLKLLSGLEMCVDKIIVANDRNEYINNSPKIDVYELSAITPVASDVIDILPSWLETPSGDVLPGGQPELCFVASTNDKRKAFMPLSKILEIREKED